MADKLQKIGILALVEREAQILIIESSEASRQTLSEAFRASGFNNIVSMGKLTDAVRYLEADRADMLVTSTFAEEGVNLLSLLNLIGVTKELQHLQVAAVVDGGDIDILLQAYEMGLLSHFFKPLSGQTAKAHISELLDTLKAWDWCPVRSSAVFLRRVLADRSQELLAFEQAIVARFPDDPRCLIPLARAFLKADDEGSARSVLFQATQAEPALRAASDETLIEYLGSGTAPADKPVFRLAQAGIRRCVVVDKDSTVRATIEAILRENEVEEIASFEDATKCWEWLDSNPTPDLLVQEWRLHGISGAALLQRVRARDVMKPYVLVASSLIKREDRPILAEMGVDVTVEKPFGKQEFVNAVTWLIKQDRFCATRGAIEAKMRRLLQAERLGEALQLKNTLFSNPKLPPEARSLIEAEFFYHSGDYLTARDLAKESLALNRSDPHALNVLAKSLFKLRDFAAALKFMERAKYHSPDNIDRLCIMAEAKSELSDFQGAANELAAAESIDADNVRVIETRAKVELAQGNDEACRNLLESSDVASTVVAFANNRAVALAFSNRHTEAIELYQTAFKSVPTRESRLLSIIAYNLALAHCRAGNLAKALEALAPIKALSIVSPLPRLASLEERLQRALQTGQCFQLNLPVSDGGASFEVEVTDAESGDMSANHPAKPERGCNGLFKAVSSDGPIVSMMKESITFKFRGTLKQA